MPDARSRGDDWELGNAEEHHAAAPRGFFIPSRAERESLEPGALVKLLFVLTSPGPDQPGAERMWVEVNTRDGEGYVGVLGNEPTAIRDLTSGDLVEDDGLEPGYVVHHPSDEEMPPWPDGSRASGWSLLVGDETSEEVKDVGNIQTPTLAWLMERYPPFGEIVFSGARDGEWRLDEAAARYVPA